MQVNTATPQWPSLYDFFGTEIDPISGRDPVQPRGHYLFHFTDIYRFTLYWTLIFYTPAFFFCGLYAFLNLTFTQQSRVRRYLFLAPRKYHAVSTSVDIPLKVRRAALSPDLPEGRRCGRPRTRHNERRSRLTFAMLVALAFAVCAVGGAVVGSAVTAYVMAGLFRAARFNMSTWIPFFLGLIQTLIGFLGLWPTVIDII
ncbi:uncharacterized protein PHACADRAFT_105877 [Phanerochaete carnosa HHB-10118-sp]|uniref:Integral membrane protein n=1 Tax=Phanerochaete carnosa (strain HHB-10118-sp) TaxID=650164 RepID=K5VTG3_PHACS|nr:uncharacterized protein PHACADRAFT_105877 [Phanerochaete carnosa HHB-10118-sp]EKM50090.1 hypothetical protein PHACADRAFT_105877 [Phanerochaete carnosa HHB-10118-sp]